MFELSPVYSYIQRQVNKCCTRKSLPISLDTGHWKSSKGVVGAWSIFMIPWEVLDSQNYMWFPQWTKPEISPWPLLFNSWFYSNPNQLRYSPYFELKGDLKSCVCVCICTYMWILTINKNALYPLINTIWNLMHYCFGGKGKMWGAVIKMCWFSFKDSKAITYTKIALNRRV